MSALGDRRQTAREAFWDCDDVSMGAGTEAAIEVATRVRITPEIIESTPLPVGRFGSEEWIREQRENLLRAAFAAAGFEVES